jgi:hypothetical protein
VQLDVERFLALVCREIGAEEAHIREDEDPSSESADSCELRWRMPDGRSVVARFAVAPADREVRQRRLEMLAGTFDTVWSGDADKGTDDARSPRSRPPPARSLREELAALCERAGAVNAVVVDANSPVVWGAAHPEGLTEPDAPQPVATIGPVAPVAATSVGANDIEPGATSVGANDIEPGDGVSVTARAAAASRIAVHVVRTMNDGAASRKGKHVRQVERSGQAPFVAHSFAGIYLLVIVYDALFDELRAERAIVEALPRIERLVLALPPLDPPTKGAGVVSMRRRS